MSGGSARPNRVNHHQAGKKAGRSPGKLEKKKLILFQLPLKTRDSSRDVVVLVHATE